MTLIPGTRLGPYEITAPLGAGGMGEVYRARDTRLGREVAVKVLPDHLSSNPEIRQRFEREAKAVSSLSHPHICTLFDIGHQDGVHFLVMELIEGESLSDRLKRGAMPVAETLRVGVQIADALEKAHKAGFVHRDLKPGNIMLTKVGAKLLDFGLARTLAGAEGRPGADAASGSEPVSATPTGALQLTAAPTAGSPLTTQGAILGTIQYMAPEQLDGREADQRTDIFALGLVLYEMVTGRRAFVADSQASLIAEIMKGEPRSPSESAPASPSSMDRIIRTCLRKDPDERFQSAHDVRLQLEWIAEGAESTAAPAAGGPAGATAGPGPARRRLPWVLVVVATLAAVAAFAGWMNFVRTKEKLAQAARPVTFSIRSPSVIAESFSERSAWADFALSPDGRSIAFAARDGQGVTRLWVRDMDVLEPRILQGTEEAENPFWSPDGRYIGFFAQGKVRKTAAEGGPVQVLCDWSGGHGGSWNEDGVILFGGDRSGGGIMKVPVGGGTPEPVTTVESSQGTSGFAERARHEWPVFLPGGRRFMYLQFSGRTDERAIFVGSLDGAEPRELFRSGFRAAFVEPDWIIFLQRDSLMAQRFDLDSLEMLGDPSVILDGVAQAVVPAEASYSVAPAGHLAVRRADQSWQSQITWYSRDGEMEETVSEEGSFVSLSMSPDGRAVSVVRTTGGAFDGQGVGETPVDIWNIDLSRGVTSRFTSRATTSDENPVWSPDGSRIAYASHENGIAAVCVRDAGGAGKESVLFASDSNPHPIDWSPDGRFLLMYTGAILGDNDLVALDLDHPDAEPLAYLTGPGTQAQGQFSPDGRWVAYAADGSGRPEVFVQSFPSGDGKWQVSSRGGFQPRWRDDGRELYYVALDGTLMAVKIEAGPGFRAGAPTALFRSEILIPGFFFYGAQAAYDVAAGGQRFLINRDLEMARPEQTIDIILNWPRPGGPAS